MIAPTPRLNFEPVVHYHAPLVQRLNANLQVVFYFPALLNAGETDAFIVRVVARRAGPQFGLKAVFLATHTFSGFVGLLRPEFEASICFTA